MSSKALVKHLKMRPEVIACLQRCGGLLVLCCAVHDRSVKVFGGTSKRVRVCQH